jgi:hypothetical protein
VINEIYIFIGVDFIQLFLKSLNDNLKYMVSLFELYKREQWTEKGFIFNIIQIQFSLVSLTCHFYLIYVIIKRRNFPIYIIGDTIDIIVKIWKGISLFL